MGSAAVYIDGGYLDKVLYYDFENQRIFYDQLALKMTEPDTLFRTYYYHCLPYQGNPPTDDERQRYASMHGFVSSLRKLPRFDVRLGKLALRGYDQDGTPNFPAKAN